MSDLTFTIGSSSEDEPKRKPGRPPGSANKSPGRPPSGAARDKLNVERALSSMGSLYEMTSLGMLWLGHAQTANLIASRQDEWQTANRKAFESSPKLASTIAGVGQTSGVVTFFVTNVMAAGMVAMAFRQESTILKDRKTKPENPEADITEAGGFS